MVFFTYILHCADKTLYCGSTNNLEKRLKQHNGLLAGGAKYTRGKQPVQLVYVEEFPTKSEALRREAEIKKLSRTEKEQLFHE